MRPDHKCEDEGEDRGGIVHAHHETDDAGRGDEPANDAKVSSCRGGTHRARPQSSKPKKPKAENRLASVARRWLAAVLPTLGPASEASADKIELLVAQAPKRWVIYEPMVLLPTSSFGFSCFQDKETTPWQAVLGAASPEQQDELWHGILQALSPGSVRLTHLAVNEGIPLHVAGSSDAENILRSPTGLRALYGDFGPATLADRSPDRPEHPENPEQEEQEEQDAPSEADFASAFWVSTKQNGLYQTWAPRWSMFSRGNIKEKARLLDWPATAGQDTGAGSFCRGAPWAVDQYAGIGYFVFSYAQRGLRVLGWELNPWSTEALRRGAVRNGWTVRVVRGRKELARPTADVVFGVDNNDDDGGSTPSIVIFVEDNQRAAQRIAELRSTALAERYPQIVHVNCGLLPTSRPVWRTAWDAVVGSNSAKHTRTAFTGWLHLHDNVGVHELDSRKQEIQALVDAWAEEAQARTPTAASPVSVVEHTELVKTFAPGVWHCVFDVRVTL